jgi:hypothetical protein
MVKVVEQSVPCLSVLSIFQQTELQYFAYNSDYKSPMVLKICQRVVQATPYNFSIQLVAQKNNLQGVKISKKSSCRI